MQPKSNDFSLQEAMRLAKSPAGQQLLALLRQGDAAALNQAMSQAAGGDYKQIQKLLAPLLATEEAKQLLAQLGGNPNG